MREGKVDQIDAYDTYLQRNRLYRVEHSPDGEENYVVPGSPDKQGLAKSIVSQGQIRPLHQHAYMLKKISQLTK